MKMIYILAFIWIFTSIGCARANRPHVFEPVIYQDQTPSQSPSTGTKRRK